MYLLFVCFSHNRDERKRPLTNTISCLMLVLKSDAVTGTIQKSSGNAWFAELGCKWRKIESSKGGTHCQELTDLSWKSMLESPAWHDWLPSWQNIHRNVSHHCRWQPPGPVLCFSSKYFPLLLVLSENWRFCQPDITYRSHPLSPLLIKSPDPTYLKKNLNRQLSSQITVKTQNTAH